MYETRLAAQKIISIVDEIKDYKGYKAMLKLGVDDLKSKKLSKEEYEKRLKVVLHNKTEEAWLNYYNSHISFLLKDLVEINKKIIIDFQERKVSKPKPVVSPKLKGVPAPTKDYVKIDKATKKRYLKELNIEKSYLRSILPGKKKKKLVLEDYTVYKSNFVSKISNQLFSKLFIGLNKQAPEFYNKLHESLRASDLKILFNSYASIMILATLLSFLIALPVSLFFIPTPIATRVVQSFALAMFLGGATFFGMYYYPISLANTRKKKIKIDLPFVTLHMAAVAGSGAQPITMFTLVLTSREYKGLEGEIRKIVNYVNLFGYNLSTALRAVALTTPSPEFKDLLNGLVTNIESGGSIKDYLDAKAQDSLSTYKLERKKYVEVLSTWSDIYTGVLIAAPLLFFTTLAIIQTLGGLIFGISVNLLAQIGTFLVIPILNIGFLLFLNNLELE